jgi:hypothetical protein
MMGVSSRGRWLEKQIGHLLLDASSPKMAEHSVVYQNAVFWINVYCLALPRVEIMWFLAHALQPPQVAENRNPPYDDSRQGFGTPPLFRPDLQDTATGNGIRAECSTNHESTYRH